MRNCQEASFTYYKLHLYGKINDIASSIFHTCCWSKVITPQDDRPKPVIPESPPASRLHPRRARDGKRPGEIHHAQLPGLSIRSLGNTIHTPTMRQS